MNSILQTICDCAFQSCFENIFDAMEFGLQIVCRSSNDQVSSFYIRDLSGSFAPYRVNFLDLWRDPTWGATPKPYAPDLEHVYQIAFQVNAPKCVADPNATCVSDDIPLKFDFWIDDLYLVNPK